MEFHGIRPDYWVFRATRTSSSPRRCARSSTPSLARPSEGSPTGDPGRDRRERPRARHLRRAVDFARREHEPAELLIMIDGQRASAGSITAVLPYYGYARQDWKSAPRVPITAKLIADLIEAAGATRVVSMDMHAGQIQGFFNVPFDHLRARARRAHAQALRRRRAERGRRLAGRRRRGARARLREAARLDPRHHRQAAHEAERRRDRTSSAREDRRHPRRHDRHGRHAHAGRERASWTRAR